MSESSAPAACPQGHDDTVKLLSTVAVGGRAAGGCAQGGRRRWLLRRGLRLRLSARVSQAEKRSTWRILFVASSAATL